MKPLTQITAGLIMALASSITVSAVPVTFKVNMLAQTALGNFNPATDSVVVAGDAINNWNTSASPLTNDLSNPGIWQETFDLTASAGSTVQYKYVMNTAGGLVWEGNVGPGGGTGNRSFALAATAQTLPVVYFNNVTNSTSVTNLITFQLDLSVQTSLGNFDPSSGTVNLAGEFNGWSASATPMTNSPTDTNIWEMTLPLSGGLGTSIGYKYIMGGTWEGNVGPGGSQNRSLTLERTNQILPAVFFNNIGTVPVPTPLVFQVDMAVQIASGNFDPTTGYVEARGSFNNNWAGGFTLTNSPDNTNIYSGTWIDSSDVPGNSIGYQFVLNGSTWETAVGNRTYTITSTNQQTLPLVFFNNLNNFGPISIQPIPIGQTTLSWTSSPLVRLQRAGLLNGPWQDVANTQGSNSVTVPIASGQQFFRLTGP